MMPLAFAAAADTMIVRQVPPIRTGFEEAIFVAAGLAQVLTLVVVVLLALIFFRMWKAQQQMHEQLARLTSKVDPMIASATSAAENVRVLTDVVRRDAVLAAEALTEATGRVRDSVSGIADRIDDFGDLLGRVTGKADAVADVAGAALHTIKLGARMLRPKPGRTRRPDIAADDEADDTVDDAADTQDDSPYASGTDAPPPAPAPRRRRRRGRGRRPPA